MTVMDKWAELKGMSSKDMLTLGSLLISSIDQSEIDFNGGWEAALKAIESQWPTYQLLLKRVRAFRMMERLINNRVNELVAEEDYVAYNPLEKRFGPEDF